MATYKRFEDLPVWQEAARLYNSVLDLLQTEKVILGTGWRYQLERAALSVSNNIAEGFERVTPGELRNFLVIARGSAGEVRSMTMLVAKRREAQLYVSQLKQIHAIAESCARQLGAWIQTFDGPKSDLPKPPTERPHIQNGKSAATDRGDPILPNRVDNGRRRAKGQPEQVAVPFRGLDSSKTSPTR